MRECMFSYLYIVSMFTLFVCVHFIASYQQHSKFINNRIKINTYCYDMRISYIREHSIFDKIFSDKRFICNWITKENLEEMLTFHVNFRSIFFIWVFNSSTQLLQCKNRYITNSGNNFCVRSFVLQRRIISGTLYTTLSNSSNERAKIDVLNFSVKKLLLFTLNQSLVVVQFFVKTLKTHTYIYL